MSSKAQTPHLAYQDAARGDAIVRTSDNVDFHLDRTRLTSAIPMLDVPPSASASEKAIVLVMEPASVWAYLSLMINFAPEEPPLADLDLIHALLKAGREYALEGMPSRMRYALLQPAVLDKEPFRVYILARAYALPDVALAAAQRTLHRPATYPTFFAALSDATAADYHVLLNYRQRCVDAAVALTRPSDGGKHPLPEWVVKDEGQWSRLAVTCHGPCASATQTLLVHEPSRMIHVRIRDAWLEYFKELAERLEKKPEASAANNAEMLEGVVMSAAGCAECGKTVFKNAYTFARTMKGKLERAIAQVSRLHLSRTH